MKGAPHRHMSYFTVLETLQKTGACALCELEARDMRRYMDHLLYENVNDAGVRGDLAYSRGYCRRHAHVLLEFADGLGTAILYLDQVKLFLDALKSIDSLSAKLRRKNLPQSWNQEALCPACVIQVQGRHGYMCTLLDWLGAPEVRKAFDAGPGLCVPHLLLALRQARDTPSREYLIAAHVGKYADLADRLAEFIRKQDYRFHGEPWGAEKDAWQRAINMMVGMKDVF